VRGNFVTSGPNSAHQIRVFFRELSQNEHRGRRATPIQNLKHAFGVPYGSFRDLQRRVPSRLRPILDINRDHQAARRHGNRVGSTICGNCSHEQSDLATIDKKNAFGMVGCRTLSATDGADVILSRAVIRISGAKVVQKSWVHRIT
jgi:hypothetical protein